MEQVWEGFCHRWLSTEKEGFSDLNHEIKGRLKI